MIGTVSVGPCTKSLPHNSFFSRTTIQLIVYRFLTGVGIGGDYPLSAVITSEFAATRVRGRMMTAVFSTQGWGTFTAALVSFIIVRAHFSSLDYLATDLQGDKTALNAALTAADRCWRLLIGIGCIPSLIGLYFRYELHVIFLDPNAKRIIAHVHWT